MYSLYFSSPPLCLLSTFFTVSPLVCAAPEAFALDRLADISEGPVALYFGLELGAALIGTMGIYYVLNKVSTFRHENNTGKLGDLTQSLDLGLASVQIIKLI